MEKDGSGNISISITDILGNEVKHATTRSMKNMIDIEYLRDGIYFVTVSDETGFTLTQKIIKNSQ